MNPRLPATPMPSPPRVGLNIVVDNQGERYVSPTYPRVTPAELSSAVGEE